MNHYDNRDTDSPRCDLCGRIFENQDELEFHSRTGQYLCRDCMAEQLSCGCEDE